MHYALKHNKVKFPSKVTRVKTIQISNNFLGVTKLGIDYIFT